MVTKIEVLETGTELAKRKVSESVHAIVIFCVGRECAVGEADWGLCSMLPKGIVVCDYLTN